MHLTTENLVRVLDTLAVKSGWAISMAEIGASESLAFAWLAKSRAAAKADDKSSPFFIEWRERWAYWHEHCGAARREHILSSEAVIRQQIRDGVETKLFDGQGRPIWLIDETVVGKYQDAEEALLCAGLEDWPFAHDERGARVQASRRELVPATTRNLLLQTMQDYQPTQHVSVKSESAVFVQHAFLRRPKDAASTVDTPLVADMRAKLQASLAGELGEKHATGKVEILGRGAGDPTERISRPSDQTGLPTRMADQPREYEPAPTTPAQPNFARPERTAERIDQPGYGSRSDVPKGGFRVVR